MCYHHATPVFFLTIIRREPSHRIWLYCDQEFTPFIVITIEDLDTYVITKYSWNCTGEKVDGETVSYGNYFTAWLSFIDCTHLSAQ